MYVYIIRLVTSDGYIIKHVCATSERAIELSLVRATSTCLPVTPSAPQSTESPW